MGGWSLPMGGRAAGGLVFVGLAALSVGSASVSAQAPRPPEVGDRVRVSSPEVSGEFLVTGLRTDSLVVRADASSVDVPVALGSVYELEIFDGKTSRTGGGVRGALLGALLGGVWASPCAASHYTCDSISPAVRVGVGVGAGLVAGALFWGGRDRWRLAQLVGRQASELPGPGRPGPGDDVSAASRLVPPRPPYRPGRDPRASPAR